MLRMLLAWLTQGSGYLWDGSGRTEGCVADVCVKQSEFSQNLCKITAKNTKDDEKYLANCRLSKIN